MGSLTLRTAFRKLSLMNELGLGSAKKHGDWRVWGIQWHKHLGVNVLYLSNSLSPLCTVARLGGGLIQDLILLYIPTRFWFLMVAEILVSKHKHCGWSLWNAICGIKMLSFRTLKRNLGYLRTRLLILIGIPQCARMLLDTHNDQRYEFDSRKTKILFGLPSADQYKLVHWEPKTSHRHYGLIALVPWHRQLIFFVNKYSSDLGLCLNLTNALQIFWLTQVWFFQKSLS